MSELLAKLPLPAAGDEGWVGAKPRLLADLSLSWPEAAATPGPLGPVAEELLATLVTPGTLLLRRSAGRWFRRDGAQDVVLETGAIAAFRPSAAATLPTWAGWSAGFLWSSHFVADRGAQELELLLGAEHTVVVIESDLSPVSDASALRLRVPAGRHLRLIELRETTATVATVRATQLRLSLEKDARVHWLRWSAGTDQSVRLVDAEVELAANAHLSLGSLLVGEKTSRVDLRVFLRGENAAVTMAGLNVAANGAVVDFRSGIEHSAGKTNSDQEMRALAIHEGSSLYHGRVVIPAGANGCEAHQHLPSLLLSRDARVQTRPQLEIRTDEVKCTHGATVGELDAAALFYLRSRGIGEVEAKRLLLEGFVATVLEPWQTTGAVPVLTRFVAARVENR